MNLKKKLLLTLGTVGIAAAAAGGGSFATFDAQTSNSGTFATGTLVMSNTVNSGTTCLSTGGGSTDTNNATCDTAFNLTVKAPGDSGTANIKITNEGSQPTTGLEAFIPACTDANAAETYHGTGLPCSKVQFYVQQYSDAAFTTVSHCLYGGATVANTCDFSDTAKTLGAFATAYPSTSQALAVTGLGTNGSAVYIKVGVKLPLNADNTYQGRKATVDLTWYMGS